MKLIKENNKHNLNSHIRLVNANLFAVIFSILLITPQAANSQVLTSAQVKSGVAQVLVNNYKKQVLDDVEVKITATPFAELQLPDGKVSYKIVQGGDRIVSRDIKRVDVYVNDAFVRTLNLPAQTSVYKEVLVALDTINREQAITRETTTLKRIDVSQNMDNILTEQVLDKEMSAKKMFQKGEIIDKRFVKMKPDVERNSGVRIFFISNGAVMVTIDGTALADGMTGDYIKVENQNYKRIYTGKVIGENRVLVSI
jgi:flagella basal body P-ring formation protein FlgA